MAHPDMLHRPDRNADATMLRLRKKHSRPPDPALREVDRQALIDAQSLPRAALVAAAVAAVLNIGWLWLSDVTGNFFPWYALLQGPFIGLAVRRAGRGLDWRFPTLAAFVTAVAAFSGNFLVSLMTTGAVLEQNALQVLRGLTVWSWQTWYDEVLTAVDLVYALAAAGVAAFYAQRRLDRREIFALRSRNQDRRK